MKNMGLLLVALGFLGAAWVASQRVESLNWTLFLPAAVVGVLGVVLARTAAKRHASHADTVASNLSDLTGAIGRIAENVAMLNREKNTIHTYDMRHKIDALMVDDLGIFADARETITVRFGLQSYAEIMGHFAAGERYLNRVWSASADGYVDEVRDYLGRAEEQFISVRDQLAALTRV
jgi:hypothetical protein